MNDRGKLHINRKSYVLTFGIHRDETIEEILENDPGYILWMESKGVATFSKGIIQEAEENDWKEEDDYRNHGIDWGLDYGRDD